MIVAIHQPNYLPWLGFFHKMANSDVFVLLDNVKHSKSSFTHRNKIKVNNKEFLLSVPLKNKESLINELILADPVNNLQKHWRLIQNGYSKSYHWNTYFEELKLIYNGNWNRLIDLNIALINFIKNQLGLKTKIVLASELMDISGEGSDRNLSICKTLGADVYLSGNGARSYNDEQSFYDAGIEIRYNNFVHPRYPQIGDSFIPNLATLDLLFNCGPSSRSILLNG